MTATPTEVALDILDRVCRLSAGDASQIDHLAALYAENADVRHPMTPGGDQPLRGREALRQHFARVRDGGAVDRIEATRVHVHRTEDPEVVVEEATYLVHARGTVTEVPNVFVLRVQGGVVVESRDYVDHLGLAQATGQVGAVLGALTT